MVTASNAVVVRRVADQNPSLRRSSFESDRRLDGSSHEKRLTNAKHRMEFDKKGDEIRSYRLVASIFRRSGRNLSQKLRLMPQVKAQLKVNRSLYSGNF
jgi:hypothetical protein